MSYVKAAPKRPEFTKKVAERGLYKIALITMHYADKDQGKRYLELHPKIKHSVQWDDWSFDHDEDQLLRRVRNQQHVAER